MIPAHQGRPAHLFAATPQFVLALAAVVIAQPALAESQPTGKPHPAETIDAGGLTWFTDYYDAYHEAREQQRMLLVYLAPRRSSDSSDANTQAITSRDGLRRQLADVVLCRVPVDARIDVDGESKPLIGFASFRELHGGPGFVMIDLAHPEAPYYKQAVSVLPLASSKYYRWSVQGLAVALSLPPGALSQRTMIWAVRMHPERPQSTGGEFHPGLAAGATQHAEYQARVQKQGHQHFERRFHTLSAAAGGGVTEVCAESWPGQSLIDSCIDCVASWRHSSGHWRGVRSPHRAYAYDIRRGGNGIWYGVGLFAN